ncbi:MAG: glycosyltransferase family 4 protein [Rhodothalassiaceae bacterium]
MNFLNADFSPIRVALFSGNYNCIMDGPARALNRLVAFLEAHGVEVHVFSPTVAEPAFRATGKVVSVPSIPVPWRSEYRLALGLPRAIRRQIEDFNPTLFHLSAPDWLGHAALRLANRMNRPAVASYHTRFDFYARYYGGFWIERPMTRAMMRFYNRCDLVLAPCRSMADELVAQGLRAPLSLWGRGVDADVFHPDKRDLDWRRSLGFDDEDVVISFVGRLVIEKGIYRFATVIDGLCQRLDRPVRCLVVGDGPSRDSFARRLPGARFTGHLSGEDLARAYASSDIFFNPSDSETFGNVTLEAMASGLPTLGVDAAGSRSLITHGVTGFLGPVDDTGQLVTLLAQMVADPGLRRAMGVRARQEAYRYRWSEILGEVLDNYGRVIERRYAVRPLLLRPARPAVPTAAAPAFDLPLRAPTSVESRKAAL